jgi:RHS repeat-associated protein
MHTTVALDGIWRVTSITNALNQTTSVRYDAVGNRTRLTDALNQQTNYAYDALDRLTGVAEPVTASYAYNGDGLRVSKTVGGNTMRYTWDVLGFGHVVADGNEYVWGAGLIGQVTGSGTATYAHADGLGSIRMLTDGMGTVIGTKQYDAFGAARSTTGVSLPFGYRGEQEDAESGLVYLRGRYVDPGTGRFLTRDPLSGSLDYPLGQHAYGYVGSSPLRWVDPEGTQATTADLWDAGGRGGIGPAPMAPSVPPQVVEDVATEVGSAAAAAARAAVDTVQAALGAVFAKGGQQQGENECTREARNLHPKDPAKARDYIRKELATEKAKPPRQQNKERIRKLEQADKFFSERNREKRQDMRRFGSKSATSVGPC